MNEQDATARPTVDALSRSARAVAWLRRARGPVVAIAAVGTVLSGLFGYFTIWRGVTSGAPVVRADTGAPLVAAPLSVVVLPFTNLTGDASQAHVADGLTASVTADLLRIGGAVVVPVSTAFGYQGRASDVKAVGRDLSGRFVLQGSVQRSGDRLRILAQLADARTGAQIWSESFDGDLGDLFTLQDKVTVRVANSIGREMVITAAREADRQPNKASINDLLLQVRALELRTQSREVMDQSVAMLAEALRQGPDQPHLLALNAEVLTAYARSFGRELGRDRRRELFAEAERLALRAQAMDERSRALYNALTNIAVWRGDLHSALQHAKSAVGVEPRNPETHANLANTYAGAGQHENALASFRKALELYPPGDEVLFFNLMWLHIRMGNPDETIAAADRAIALNTPLPDAYFLRAIAYSMKGDEVATRSAVDEFKRRYPGLTAATMYPPPPPPWSLATKFRQEVIVPAWRAAGLP
ncbi:MAG: tetratricopeptide repeat protein [Rubrivivax sp.]|nr:tetratricopeptide repeat protein [Rubrivivax sp.]